MRQIFEDVSTGAPALVARLQKFCFPHGEDAAAGVLAIKTRETGQIRMSNEARWIPFTAEQVVVATQSSFRWEARLDPGKFAAPTVTDAYEEGHGRVSVKLGGLLPVKKVVGPDADKGELQRYLSSFVICPAMLLNHPTLEWSAAGPSVLRMGDRQNSAGATIDVELSEEGCPVAIRAQRPRMVGKKTVITPWVATGGEFREYEGMRVATRLEVSWDLPEGELKCYLGKITSFATVRL